ncbi:MAG TPA: hypothetical protein VK386_05880 [Acidimicrobiales bacterium]|nr:hypothetical protein [Acidimicrobiales bacterium]
MKETIESIGGWKFDGRGPSAKPFQRGRRCSEPDCATLLSIYNPGRFCAEHEPKRSPRLVGRKAS